MHIRPFAVLALAFALLAPRAPAAWSQAEPTVEQIYQAASNGQLREADAMIDQVLRNHPNSARAHYVKAELAARESNAAVAREELATAERLAPGLPFARPEAVQALREEVNGRARPGTAGRTDARPAASPALPHHPAHQFSWGLAALIAAIAIGLFALLRRRRSTTQPGSGMHAARPSGMFQPRPGSVAPGMPAAGYGEGNVPGGGMGSTLGRGLATGLAVGAGAVAAQEIGRRMFGHDASPIVSSGAPADVEPGLLDPSVNADMGGRDFGIEDPGSWDDAGSGDWGTGGGSDWDT
jgi:hypothetical protein